MEGDIDIRIKEEGKKRKVAFKIMLILSLIYTIILLLLSLLIYYTDIGYKIINFLPISLFHLITIGCIIFVLFTIIMIGLHVNYTLKRSASIESIKPIPPKYKGKNLYTFTYPEEAKGGLFSKTIIEIDDSTVLNLRCQIIEPQELWK